MLVPFKSRFHYAIHSARLEFTRKNKGRITAQTPKQDEALFSPVVVYYQVVVEQLEKTVATLHCKKKKNPADGGDKEGKGKGIETEVKQDSMDRYLHNGERRYFGNETDPFLTLLETVKNVFSYW